MISCCIGCSHHYRKSHESDGQAGIVQEELMAYVNVRVSNNNSFICFTLFVNHARDAYVKRNKTKQCIPA